MTARAGTRGNSAPLNYAGSLSRPSTPTTTRGSRSWVGLILGVVILAFGGYQAMVASQSLATPTTVPIGVFEDNPPDNRNVIITGGRFDLARSVKFQEFHFHGDTNPTITYYVPLLDGPPGAAAPAPKVMVKIAEVVFNRDKNTLSDARLPGTRLTQWDFDGKVRDKMRESFGDAVNNMIVVDYGETPSMAVALVMILIGLVFLFARNLW